MSKKETEGPVAEVPATAASDNIGGVYHHEQRNMFQRAYDSFKPGVVKKYDPSTGDVEKVGANSDGVDENGGLLKRDLKNRHIQMIAIGRFYWLELPFPGAVTCTRLLSFAGEGGANVLTFPLYRRRVAASIPPFRLTPENLLSPKKCVSKNPD